MAQFKTASEPNTLPMTILGNAFTNSNGENFDASVLEGKIVGVYFSAHW